jgi:hypothetical protein
MPLNVNLVGCMGYDWQAQIAELPDALISSLSREVIPALEVCRLRPGAAVDTYSGLRVYIDRAQDVVENCQTQMCTIAKVFRQCPSKQSQIDAVASAQSLLRDMVMLLDDIREECIKSDAAFTECNFLRGGHRLQFCWQSRDFYHDVLPHLHGSL